MKNSEQLILRKEIGREYILYDSEYISLDNSRLFDDFNILCSSYNDIEINIELEIKYSDKNKLILRNMKLIYNFYNYSEIIICSDQSIIPELGAFELYLYILKRKLLSDLITLFLQEKDVLDRILFKNELDKKLPEIAVTKKKNKL